MTAVLLAERLTKRFGTRLGLRRRAGSEVPAVDRVSLDLERGRTLGVVGESGSGKTTVARMLVGLTRPTSGRVLLDGTDVTDLPQRVLHQRVQYVFQDPYSSLNPRRSVGRSIEVPLKYLTDQDATTRRRTVRDLLDRTGLHPEVVDRYPHELSGGQRQRVVVARAVAARPDVLVLDEPVSALDVSVQAQILSLLRSLQADTGMTYLFISHDLAVVDTLSDDVLVMRAGTVVEGGPRCDVFGAPRHPYTHQLLAAVPGARRAKAT